MTNHIIRSVDAAEDLSVLTDPDPLGWTAAMWRDFDAAAPTMSTWVAEVDGRLVGYVMALPLPLTSGGFGVAYGRVDPAYRRLGIGSALRERVHEALRGRVPGVQYLRDESDLEAAAAAKAWGLEQTGAHAESALDLTTINSERFTALSEVEGIDFALLDPSMPDQAWESLYAFVAALVLDAPDNDPDASFAPLEMFRHGLTEPWSLITAHRAGDLVGVTLVVRRAGSEGAVNTWFTGVTATARHLGIATALKARQALALAEAGISRIYTQNMDGNTAILHANATLGFTPSLRYVDLREHLTDAAH